MFLSIIIPIYNRPDELDELLFSISQQTNTSSFEVIIVEDGSTVRSNQIVEKYASLFTIHYYYKPNSGPGDSRNFGMTKANGDYFIILDSDTIIPHHFL